MVYMAFLSINVYYVSHKFWKVTGGLRSDMNQDPGRHPFMQIDSHGVDNQFSS